MSDQHSIRWINHTQLPYGNILFIGHPTSQLANHIRDAIGQCGMLSMSLHPDSNLISARASYNCYVLDADFLGDVTETMHHILLVQPRARILVVSDSYDWEDARDSFRRGAIDVIRLPKSSKHMRDILNTVQRQQLPDYRGAGVG